MKTILTLEAIYAPVHASLNRVPVLIRETLDTPIAKMREMVDHFFSKNGKLLRPTLIFLGAGLSRSLQPVQGILSERNETAELYLAAATEIFHAATLIHDASSFPPCSSSMYQAVFATSDLQRFPWNIMSLLGVEIGRSI